MAKYTVKQAQSAVEFWTKQLDEAIAFESEEDQQKEKEADMSGQDTDVEKSKDDEIAELKAKVEELEAKLASQDSSDENADDDSDKDETAEDTSEEDDTEEDSEETASDEESDEESDEKIEDDSDSEDEKLDEAIPGTTKYAPNTVGAVCELLKKSDPNDMLMIRLNPGSVECMIIDIDRKITMKNGITYMEIVKGKPI